MSRFGDRGRQAKAMIKEPFVMEKFLITIGSSVIFIACIVIVVPCATAFSGLAGWIIGYWFGDNILDVAEQLGIHGVTMTQLGEFLGFVGSFLRTTTTIERNNN